MVRTRTVHVRAPQPGAENDPDRQRSITYPICAILLLLLIGFFALYRSRLLDLPLERDEGEYAYAGQLILDGIPPYKLAYNMKWPGTYAAYAVIMAIGGESVAAIRAGMIVITSITAVLVFMLGRRLWGSAAGLIAAATQLTLSVLVEALALWGHATHFVALFAVAGFLLLTGERRWECFLAGVMLGLATIMKQPGVFFAIAGVALLASRREWKRALLVITGGFAAMLGLFAILHLAGVFPRFWFWTFEYARQYGVGLTFIESIGQLKLRVASFFTASPLIWIVALSGFLLVRRHRMFIALFALAGVLATTPGLYFRSHYFIVLFPAAALLVGAAASAAYDRLAGRGMLRLVPVGIVVVALVVAVARQWSLTDTPDAEALTRRTFGTNPFAESVVVADYIRERTRPDETIAVIGSEPQVYFYSGRRSATGYIYTYALMEPHEYAARMQREMIAEISRSNPRFMLIVNVPGSWLATAKSDQAILDWAWSHPADKWAIDGVADIRPNGTHYVFGKDAALNRPRSREFLLLLRRVGS